MRYATRLAATNDLPACLANSSPMMSRAFYCPAFRFSVGASLLAKIANHNAADSGLTRRSWVFREQARSYNEWVMSGQGFEQRINILQHTRIALLAPVQGDHLLVRLDLVDVGRQR